MGPQGPTALPACSYRYKAMATSKCSSDGLAIAIAILHRHGPNHQQQPAPRQGRAHRVLPRVAPLWCPSCPHSRAYTDSLTGVSALLFVVTLWVLFYHRKSERLNKQLVVTSSLMMLLGTLVSTVPRAPRAPVWPLLTRPSTSRSTSPASSRASSPSATRRAAPSHTSPRCTSGPTSPRPRSSSCRPSSPIVLP